MIRRRLLKSLADDEQFVDLGLPSGRIWTKGNLVKNNGDYFIGAETDLGAYVSWGNIVGYNDDDGYSFDSTNYSKTSGYKTYSNISSTDATRDICYARLGSPWHLPTRSDFQELLDNTDSEWISDYNNTGIAGRKFMKKTDHSVFIFLPASGWYQNLRLFNRGVIGQYMTSSRISGREFYCMKIGSYAGDNDPNNEYYREYGYTIRAVS